MLNLNYCVSTGVWSQDDGTVIVPEGNSWSGNNSNPEVNPDRIIGKNNIGEVTGPDGTLVPAQSIHCIGAIPCAVWRFGAWGDHSSVEGYPQHLGPMICHLTPVPNTGDTFGRTGIYVHGPSSGEGYGQESEGCVVTLRPYRLKIAQMQPTTLTVTP